MSTKSAIVYTDGAFFDVHNVGVYAFVVLAGNEDVIYSDSNFVPSKYNKSRQIGAELLAVIKAIEYCVKNKVNLIELYTDFIGLQNWLTGKWKIKAEVVSLMVSQISKLTKDNNIKLSIHHVDAHSGDKWNEVADKMCLATLTKSKSRMRG
ncbi:MAG: reverse transcriptase-like protein [Prolixibacteraceae bacterium]|nr:reverse transcriptase-like protein [Prolixibacteraceae bacterium]